MRAKEFISEDIIGKLSKRAEMTSHAVLKLRDPGGYDRTNWLNRAMMAAACADGKNTNKIEGIDSYSWAEKYNTAHPYTEEEYKMMKQVIATVPTDCQVVVPWSPSMEPESTNKKSIVQGFKGFQ
jgi:hypothetical protein